MRALTEDPYAIAIARELGATVDAVLSTLDTYRCTRCRTVYCDPWLSSRGMNRLYAVGQPQHLAGWERFYQWLQRPSTQWIDSEWRVWELLRRLLGKVESYAEVNCPFFGLLMPFCDASLGDSSKTRLVTEIVPGIQRAALHPNARGPIARRLRKLGVRVESAFSGERAPRTETGRGESLRSVARKLRYHQYRRHLPITTLVEGASVPAGRYVILQDTSCTWRSGCTSMGCSCLSLAASVLGCSVVTYADADREGIRFDAICMFNTLDHFMEPMAALSLAVDRARIVYVDVHSQREFYGRQHPFVFGENFLEDVPTGDWSIVNVTDIVRSRQNSYLVSSKIDLAETLGLSHAPVAS